MQAQNTDGAERCQGTRRRTSMNGRRSPCHWLTDIGYSSLVTPVSGPVTIDYRSTSARRPLKLPFPSAEVNVPVNFSPLSRKVSRWSP